MNVPYNKSHSGSELVQKWMNSFFGTKPEDCDNVNYTTKAEEGSTDIYITTFGNNGFFIEYEIKTLKRFFLSPHNIIIVDTNQDLHLEISKTLKSICEREGVIYLKAPDNHYQEQQHFDSTMKLGTTLNFLHHNCVKQRQPTYFGFLDHDCFLFRPTTTDDLFIRKIKNTDPFAYNEYATKRLDMYGTVSQNLPKWNLHVITNFFRYERFKGVPLDFRASYKHGLDTGGANRDIIPYVDNEIEDYRLSHIGIRYTNEDVGRLNSVQHYEVIDSRWMHMCASTHDLLAGDVGGERKMLYTKGFLDAVLRVSEIKVK